MMVLGVHCLLGSFLMPAENIKTHYLRLHIHTSANIPFVHSWLHGLTVVVGDDMQAVEQLPLVLVDSLDLNVKHGIGVDLHFVVLLQVCGELQLVFLC